MVVRKDGLLPAFDLLTVARSSAKQVIDSRPALPTDPKHERASALAYWLFQVLAWGAYVASGLAVVLPKTGPQANVVGGYVLFFFYSIALTHGLRAWIRRRDWLSLSPGGAIVRLLTSAIVLSVILALLICVIDAIWRRIPIATLLQSFFLTAWIGTLTASILWTAFYTGAASLLRARRLRQNAIKLELDVREARLKALEAQIGPHFLFNSLNSLRGLILEDPPLAQDIVTRLANILRRNLTRTDSPTEPLRDQVDFTTDYLALEQIRFEERLRTRLEIAPDTLPFAVPAMLLQMLVENAIKHGIAHLPEGGEIVISTHLDPLGELVIVVENTGKLARSPTGSTRVGLRNLRERLRVLHGLQARLEILETTSGTVRAEVRIPRMRPAAPL